MKKEEASTYLRDRNTAIMLETTPIQRELWSDDVKILSMKQKDRAESHNVATLARRLDVFLDVISAYCAVNGTSRFLMNNRFAKLLTPAEKNLKLALNQFLQNVKETPEVKRTPAWPRIEALLADLGVPGYQVGGDRRLYFEEHIKEGGGLTNMLS